jgi:hypothetical protein
MATFKQPKQPAFPHPPLDVGVAQYPTPVVPDYYTKSGHIILVVKESIEKGNYNPKPLDGSVTYSGRDANKWPSTLYLVYQQPTPDGEYVYNTYANDRTLASQDPWNYGIDYSLDDPTKPIYTREYIVPRSQYAVVAKGSTDPVFGGTAVISKQAMRELPDNSPLRSRYVIVQRIYETLPGAIISTKSFDPLSNTHVYTESDQIVTNSNSNVPSIISTVNPEVFIVNEYQDIDSIHSKKKIKDYSNLIGVTWTEYQTTSFTYPALLYVTQAGGYGFLYSANDVVSYRLSRSVRTQATITYKISKTPDTETRVVTFIPVTIISDYGTFSNVIHNVSYTKINNTVYTPEKSLQNLSSEESYTEPYSSNNYVFGDDLIIENDSTLLKGYGGLYLIKTTSIKLN